MRVLIQRIVFVAVFFTSIIYLRSEEPLNISTNQSTNLALKQISPGVFQIGQVRLNKEKKIIQFPATVNMTNGLVEYFLVTGTGKLHESVLKTDAEPAQIHIAMLFIGTRGAPTNSSGTNIFGDKITIEVNWKNAGGEKNVRAEDFVFNTETKSPMSKGAWIYNGSKVMDGTFIAQRDGSIVSIIIDPLAMANNPRPGHENDEIWLVNTNSVPALNTPVEVTFKLE